MIYDSEKLNKAILEYQTQFESFEELVVWQLPENDFTITKFIELIKTAIKQNKKIKNDELLEALNLQEIIEIDGEIAPY
tara:strand:- start:541 stop:777 length:237 start_codon:yes stop_codon:yes gene_type:complete